MKNKKNALGNALGFIQLETGLKAVTPMDDVFINFTFQNSKYWETLRLINNIFYEAYKEVHQDTKLMPIEGEISVKTQFPHFKKLDSSKPKMQDTQIDSVDKVSFIEFQNSLYPNLHIAARSVQYFGYSLTRGHNKPATTMWLLNGTVTELLDHKTFANFILMDEQDHRPHPDPSNILFVDLKKLAGSTSKAGELASVLLGSLTKPSHDEVKQVYQHLKESFLTFKEDTEVRQMMSKAELLKAEGEARLQPLLEEKNKLLNEQEHLLGEQSSQLSEQKHLLDEKDSQLSEQEKRIAELEALLNGQKQER